MITLVPKAFRLVAVNEQGKRMGEGHGRAKLTDDDVRLIVELLDAREVLITEYQKVGLTKREIERALAKTQLSYSGIAGKFEISKSQIRWIAIGSQRGRVAVKWKRVITGACT
jgi:hypothetical protein